MKTMFISLVLLLTGPLFSSMAMAQDLHDRATVLTSEDNKTFWFSFDNTFSAAWLFENLNVTAEEGAVATTKNFSSPNGLFEINCMKVHQGLFAGETNCTVGIDFHTAFPNSDIGYANLKPGQLPDDTVLAVEFSHELSSSLDSALAGKLFETGEKDFILQCQAPGEEDVTPRCYLFGKIK